MELSCHTMRKGQIFMCKDCGLQLKVVAECKECGTDKDACGCEAHCTFECCGQPLTLKK